MQQSVRTMYQPVMAVPAVVTVSAAAATSFWASRSDTCGVTSGNAVITDTSITAADFGKPVSGTGIPANSYVGTVIPGVSFRLSSATYTNVDRLTTQTNASIALTIGTTAQSIANNSPLFKAVGGVPAEVVGQVGYYQNNILNLPAGGGPRLFPRMVWEFDTDSLCPEVKFYGANNYNLNSAFRILVDGEYVSLTPKVAATDWTASSAQFRIKIDLSPLGSAKTLRRIGVETALLPFGGVDIGPFDTIAYPARSRAIRAMFVGDSITVGISSAQVFDTWAQWCARTLGWEEVFINAIGGSGYLNPGAGYGGNAGQNIYDRRETIKAVSPDVIVFAAGVNDTTNNNAAYTGAALQAQVAAVLADLAADPRTAKALVYVIGPFRGSAFPISAALEATRSAVISAATAAPNVKAVFDPITEAWLTGNGNYSTVSSTNPRGNSEVYLLSDGLHPQSIGHEGYGRRAAADIVATLGA